MPNAFGSNLRFVQVIAALAATTSAVGVAADDNSLLRLHGGNHLTGRWQTGDQADALLWQTDFAEGVFAFRWEKVSQVVLPEPEEPFVPTGRYRFELVGGDSLRGDFVRVEPDWVTIAVQLEAESKPSELRVRRGALRRVVALESQGELIYQGPDAPSRWVTGSPSHWQLSGRALSTSHERTTIFRDVKLPDRFLIELDLAWIKDSDFEIQLAVPEQAAPLEDEAAQRRRQQFGQPPKLAPVGGFSLRSVGGWLVATRELAEAAHLQPLIELPADGGRFRCRLYGDQQMGRLLVTTPNGQTLADFTAPAPKPKRQTGIRITNHRGSLRVKGLRAYQWEGATPVATVATRPGTVSPAGQFTPGVLTDYDRQRRTFVFTNAVPEFDSDPSPANEPDASTGERQATDNPPTEQPTPEGSEGETPQELGAPEPPAAETELSDDGESSPTVPQEAGSIELKAEAVAAITLKSADVVVEPAADQVTLMLRDGSQITGKPRELNQRILRLETGMTQQAMDIPLAVVREVRGLGQPVSENEIANKSIAPWTLETDSSRIRGQLSRGVSTEGGSYLVWQPIGSQQGLPLRDDTRGKIFLPSAEPKPAKPSAVKPSQPAAGRGLFGAVARILGGNPSAPSAARRQSSAKRAVKDPSVIYLRGGDKLPCRVSGIGPDGVAIESRYVSTDQVAHEHVKAIELKTRGVEGKMVKSRRDRLLTLPRQQQDYPPTHLLVSTRGDYLRCRLLKLDESHTTIEIHLEEHKIERSRIARIIWLDPPPQEELADDTTLAASDIARLRIQARRRDGVRMTFYLTAVEERAAESEGLRLVGVSPAIGDCEIDLDTIEVLHLGMPDSPPSPKETYQLWAMRAAKTPREGPASSAADSTAGSSLVGQTAPDLQLPWASKPVGLSTDTEQFELSDLRGQVVVLDFWASWCGPCVRSMPDTKRLVDEFNDRGVVMIGVNLQETPDEVAASLERMKLELPVALDRDGVAAQRYEVTGIPQTVVIDRDGEIARLLIGGGPDTEQLLREAIEAASIADPSDR